MQLSIRRMSQTAEKRLDTLTAFLLAVLPILQHYIGIVDSASTVVLVLLFPYLLYKSLFLLKSLTLSRLSLLLTLMMFFVFKFVDHGTNFTETVNVCLMLCYLMFITLGCVDTRTLTRIATGVAVAAGVCVILQYICYYALGFHLQFVPTELLLEESSAWIPGVKTGVVGINGKVSRLYRPCAFFLEPSHLFMYSFPLLFINLFAPDRRAKRIVLSLLISAATVLSTSGMGIAVTAAAWGLFIAFWNHKDDSFRLKNLFCKRNLILIGILFVCVILAIIFVPFVRDSIIRIFSKSTGSSAISGRTTRALLQIRKHMPLQWIIGAADSLGTISFNMPGFMATLYKYGFVGVILSYEFYVKGLFKLNMPYFWFTVVLLGVSFFSAHTHGTFFMLYYVMLLTEGHNVATGEWQCELKEMFSKIKSGLKRSAK